jgi:hypothetical protein
MKKLTTKNYHSPDNNYLTNSKINDYIRDPYYFYQKHILRTVVEEKSDALIVGSAVDTYIFSGKAKFNRLFKVVARRNKAEPPEGYTELTQGQYEEIIQIVSRIKDQEIMKELKNFKKQVILFSTNENGKWFSGLAGMLDWLHVSEDGKEGCIVDLKTSNTIDPNKYYWHCRDYGYFRQMAMYQGLVLSTYGIPNVPCYHLVVEKDSLGIYNPALFKISQEDIDNAKDELINIYTEIETTEEFKKKNVNFGDAVLCGMKTV